MIVDDGQAYADYGDSDDEVEEEAEGEDQEGGRGRGRAGLAPSTMRPSELSGAIEMLQQQRVDEFGSEDADEVLRRVLQLEEGGDGEEERGSDTGASTTSLSSKVGGFFRIGFASSSSPGSSASAKKSASATGGSASSSGRDGLEDDLDEADEDVGIIDEEED